MPVLSVVSPKLMSSVAPSLHPTVLVICHGRAASHRHGPNADNEEVADLIADSREVRMLEGPECGLVFQNLSRVGSVRFL